MTRLTTDLRQSIARAAVAHAFDPKLEALRQREDALAREAYAAVITDAETKAVAACPDNWFRRDECLRFNVGGLTIRLRLLDEGLPVPYRAANEEAGGYHCGNLGTIKPGDLCDRIQAHAHAEEDYKVERRDASRNVMAMLANITTMKRLREAWPQGEPFYKSFEDAPAPGLPAVRVDEINAMLGIAA